MRLRQPYLFDFQTTAIVVGNRQLDNGKMFRHKLFNLLRPLHKAVVVTEEIVLITKIEGFFKIFDAVKIEMENTS